jgi:hypothetical protein
VLHIYSKDRGEASIWDLGGGGIEKKKKLGGKTKKKKIKILNFF